MIFLKKALIGWDKETFLIHEQLRALHWIMSFYVSEVNLKNILSHSEFLLA